MKAWAVRHKDNDEYIDIVLAETRNKARKAIPEYEQFEYLNYRATRVPGADNAKEITPKTYIENGFGFMCSNCERMLTAFDNGAVMNAGFRNETKNNKPLLINTRKEAFLK